MRLPRSYSLSHLLLFAFLVLGFLLRIIWLDQIPPGFNWDEASVGFNAYSLAQTGKDEFGKPWPIIMEAFGEHKIGLYSIMLAPLVKLWGLSVFTVRFPNVIFGTLLILTSYWLARQFLKQSLVASLVAGLIAISPWAIQTSRFTLEWYFGMPLTVLAITLLLKAQKQPRVLPLAALLFAGGLYSYHSLRVFIPLFLLAYAMIFRHTLAQHKKAVIAALIVGALALIPLLLAIKQTQFFSRAQAVSILQDEDLHSKLMEGIFRQTKIKLPLVRVFNNKVVFYGKEAIDRYLAHFSPNFLFSGQDVTQRIGIDRVGKLYYTSLPFLLIGLFELAKRRKKLDQLLLVWILLAPVPSSFTMDTPHALRSLPLVPALQIVTATGMITAYHFFKAKRPKLLIPFCLATAFCYLAGFGYFLWRFWLFYPEDSAASWQAGHQEMVRQVTQYQDRFDTVVITTFYGQPHIFLAFFTPLPPAWYQEQVNQPDQQPIFNERIPHLGKFQFRQVNNEDFCLSNTLVVTDTERGRAPGNFPRLDVVRVPNRFYEPKIVFELYDTNEPQIRETLCQ